MVYVNWGSLMRSVEQSVANISTVKIDHFLSIVQFAKEGDARIQTKNYPGNINFSHLK